MRRVWERAVGFVQSAVRMYERTYAYTLCSFTYGCARRRAVVGIRGYRTEHIGRQRRRRAGPTFFHSSRNLPSGASSSCSIIFPSDLRYA